MHHLYENPKICYSLKFEIGEEEGGELGGSLNNHNLKKMNQAYIQIKQITFHDIKLIDFREYNIVKWNIIYI